MLSEADFRKKLKENPTGIYLFFGDEDYLKSYCVRAARNAVCPDEGLACFNDVTIDFPEYTPEALENALSSPPMMTDCKLVVLKSIDFGTMNTQELDTFCNILEAYQNDTSNLLLLSVIPNGLDVGTPKKPSPLYTRLCKLATMVSFDAATPQKLITWIQRHFASKQIHISESQARLLMEISGKGMYTLSSEIEKLCFYILAHGRNQVTDEDIRFVAVPVEECDAFALTNAAMAGQRKQALDVLVALRTRQVKPEYVFGDIARLYSELYLTKLYLANGKTVSDIASLFRIHSYKAGLYAKAVDRVSFDKLRHILSLCQSTDLALKSYAKRNYEQIEKLICLI